MKWEIHCLLPTCRKGLLFLSGRGKELSSWNNSSSGDEINLEKGFRVRGWTCLVEFEDDDVAGYDAFKQGKAPENPMEGLFKHLDAKVKWLVVASSMGAYFASLIPEEKLLGLVLIDPVNILTRLQYKVPVQVHLVVDTETRPDLEFWAKITAYDVRSRVVVHWGQSHLIHWSQPGKIRSSIEDLLRHDRK